MKLRKLKYKNTEGSLRSLIIYSTDLSLSPNSFSMINNLKTEHYSRFSLLLDVKEANWFDKHAKYFEVLI